ncbi:hypothetical protein HZF05_08445 [Sphingomonas sp. CGMCC 1.13654]|uniref:Uncharacterized protein n=1 Tax=Sphingomonas chungangi TaxID=2683589 RepID=A0A838L6M2_9SPHN|nr:hypothetical protein [Sphingomonas chungangi]MBA2934129.1 hypothetical protein [Sphingomonas chungangi]MVW57170.1 hypothetical protein [Sphingomonas chungangi]
MPRRRPVRLVQPEPRPLVPAEALARLGELGETEMGGTQLPHPAHGPIEALPRDAQGFIPAVHSPQEIDEEGLEPPAGLRPGPGAPLRDPAPGAPAATPADDAQAEGVTDAERPPAVAHSADTPSPAPRHDGLTPERQRIFFETLAATASVSRAAKACGLSRQALYAQRNRADADAFREAWDVAMTCAINLLGDIAYDRAIEGVEEPVFWKGEQVGTRRRFNDNLLMTLLRVRDPFGFAPQSDLRHWAGAHSYAHRPRLDEALAALQAEADGASAHRPGDGRRRPGKSRGRVC